MQHTFRAWKTVPFPNVYLMDQLPAIFNDFFINKFHFTDNMWIVAHAQDIWR